VFHLLDLFDRLGFASAPALVGSSLGGWMAAEVAARYPSSVSTLVLIGPAGLHIEGARIGEIFGRRPGDLAEDLFLDQSHPIAAVMHQMDSLEDNRLAEIPFEMIRPTLQSLQATAKIAWNPYLHDPKLVRLLPRVTAPTLVIHGAQDRLIPRVHASTYAETIPNARLADVDQAGHLVALEKPGEVAALIEAHLHGAGDVDKNGHGAAGAGPV
jgi:pimeloyl-ACP methyl ester carboxylesterase